MSRFDIGISTESTPFRRTFQYEFLFLEVGSDRPYSSKVETLGMIIVLQ